MLKVAHGGFGRAEMNLRLVCFHPNHKSPDSLSAHTARRTNQVGSTLAAPSLVFPPVLSPYFVTKARLPSCISSKATRLLPTDSSSWWELISSCITPSQILPLQFLLPTPSSTGTLEISVASWAAARKLAAMMPQERD